MSIAAAFAVLSGRYAAALQAAAAEHDRSPQTAVALLHLRSVRETRMSECARAMACDAGNVSGTIDRLEDADLVVRLANLADKRVRIIRTPRDRRKRLCATGHRVIAWPAQGANTHERAKNDQRTTRELPVSPRIP